MAGVRQASRGDQDRKPLSPALSLQDCLVTKLNIVPAAKGKLFKGRRPIFEVQAIKGEFGAKRQGVGNRHTL